MSKELEQFKRNYEDFVKSNTELVVNLSKSPLNLNLVLSVNNEEPDFSKRPWIDLNNKTLADFKALVLYKKINTQIVPIVYPNVNIDPESGKIKINPFDKLLSPHKITPAQFSQALDSIKEIAQEAIQETISNRTNFEVILNFLKSCANFLIACVTLGYQKNFFKSSTFQLEQIKNAQQDIHTLFDNLNEEEKTIELERPNELPGLLPVINVAREKIEMDEEFAKAFNNYKESTKNNHQNQIKIKTLNKEIADLNKGIEEGIEDLNKGLEDLNKGLEDQSKKLEDLKQDFQDVKQDFQDVKQDFQNLKSEIDNHLAQLFGDLAKNKANKIDEENTDNEFPEYGHFKPY